MAAQYELLKELLNSGTNTGGGALRAPRRKNIPDTQGTGCQQLCTVAVPV